MINRTHPRIVQVLAALDSCSVLAVIGLRLRSFGLLSLLAVSPYGYEGRNTDEFVLRWLMIERSSYEADETQILSALMSTRYIDSTLRSLIRFLFRLVSFHFVSFPDMS
jgi:hypothetical protein